jgi:indolepyruvate ferredoxin oxidoreductase alpha subunit
MTDGILDGDRALARGAAESGIALAAGYPGSPSSGTMEALIELAEEHGFYLEWSSNERVALELAVGASIAGRRALVCVKSVGLNVMIDPLMALNLTPVHGGLVILVGDDPGGYGSQNDQDSRALMAAVELPLLEPSGPAEARIMMHDAFDLSERFRIPVFVRETRSFTGREETVSIDDAVAPTCDLGLVREPFRFVPVPDNAVEKHRGLHLTLEAVRDWMERSGYVTAIGSGRHGLIAAGFVFSKLVDILGNDPAERYHILKLNALCPLPRRRIAAFLHDCEEVLILEENEPFVERHVRAIAHDAGCGVRVFGKESGHVSREGELYRWQIQEALAGFLADFSPATAYSREGEVDERPAKESHCADCGYDRVLDAFEEAAGSLGEEPVVVGDPGCLVTVADRLDAKYAIGSAVGVADGLSKAGRAERAVAFFGDSAFFHSALPAICNAVHSGSDIVMVVLDNQATAATGFQTHPGVGRDAFGRKAPALDIEGIARACGVDSVLFSGPDDPPGHLTEMFRVALSQRELTLCIVRLAP